ncbi:leucine-zipper-like transcriptional regulator 1 homolog [Drosophila teissieri]|uniref:leucine-zipper-like transcriptional regulator 1 homolog n=1 Tax=Drosophila teissieri TaxID=7243 RepID=UPI001CBA28D6|nr:leucine-zipper-like transcriptional regulator 1 homolog [Drosophila teissieri]
MLKSISGGVGVASTERGGGGGGGGGGAGGAGGSASGSRSTSGSGSGRASCGLGSSSISSGLSAVCGFVTGAGGGGGFERDRDRDRDRDRGLANSSGGSTPAGILYCPACVAAANQQNPSQNSSPHHEGFFSRSSSKSSKRNKARKSASTAGCLDAQHIRANLRMSMSSSMRSSRGNGGGGAASSSHPPGSSCSSGPGGSGCGMAYDAASNASSGSGSGSGKATSPGSYSCNALNVDFTSYTATHQWTRMLECAEFVGAKRSKHTVVAYKDAMFVFGGDNGKNMLNDLIRFGVKDKSWGRACATGTPPAPRYHHSAVVAGSSMFIFGGYTGDIHSNSNLTNKNDLFEYKFQSAMWVEWKFSGRQPVPRSAHGAAVYDNKMWIYAGYDGNARLNDMWTLNLTGENHQWEEVDQLGDRPPTCCNFPVAVARDAMYVFSGQSGLQITNSLFEFHFKTRTWRRISNEPVLRGATSAPPSRRYGHTMVHHDRFLYVFGGSADSTLPNDLHCYDLDSQVWSVILPEQNSDVPSGRVFHASAVICDAMYIFGGTVDNSVRRGDTYRFQFSSYPKCTLRDDFGKFFLDKQFCDIQFIVGAEEIRILAHIAFVAARSKYLRNKILAAREARQQQMEKVYGVGQVDALALNTGAGGDRGPMLEVRLANASPEAFEIILNYIYTDRIDLKDTYSKNIIILITDIYQLAGLFTMPRLAHGCIQYLDYKINKLNVLEALYNADKSNIKIIKDHCMQFIIKEENFTEVVMSSEFSDLDKPLLVEIIRKRLHPSKLVIDTSYEGNIGTTLEIDLCAFLESTGNDFCDISLVLEDHVIPAHKSVLSSRCTYFQGMFRSFMPPDNTVNIQIGEISPSLEAFHSLLRYIYYGETKMPPQDALYLFQAPCFYGLANNRLHAFCKYSLEHNITFENVLQTLEASDITKIYDIKLYALKLIVKDFAKVARLPKIAGLSRELLLEIIRAVADSHGEFLTRININTDI